MRLWTLMLCVFLAISAVFTAGSGCGDGLVNGEYRGEPLFRFQGVIFSIMDQLPEESSIRVAIAWIPRAKGLSFDDGVIEQNSVSMTIRFPSLLEVNIFHPPQPEAFGDKKEYAWGYIIVYEDWNDNQRFEPEELLGGSPWRGILYAPQDVPQDRSPTGGILPKGFSLLHLPFECGQERWKSEQECGVPLGAPCSANSDCNASSGGLCVDYVQSIDFPGGYCTMEAREGGCIPKDGYPVQFPDIDYEYWMKRCTRNSDCREAEGYTCSITEGSCFPELPVLIEIYEELQFSPFCYSDVDDGNQRDIEDDEDWEDHMDGNEDP